MRGPGTVYRVSGSWGGSAVGVRLHEAICILSTSPGALFVEGKTALLMKRRRKDSNVHKGRGSCWLVYGKYMIAIIPSCPCRWLTDHQGLREQIIVT